MSALEIEEPVRRQRLPLQLETERLVLRRAELTDATRYAQLLNNQNVAANLSRVTLPYTPAHTREWLPQRARSHDPHNFSFAITTEEDGLIGNVGFHTEPDGKTHIGYWLGEDYWGRGIMSEATQAAITWFFDNTDFQYLCSGVFHFNMASLAIQYKLGFVETGRSTKLCAARGAELEHIDTELNKEDFEASLK